MFYPKAGNKISMSALTNSIRHCTRGSSPCNNQEMKINSILPDFKGRSKIVFISIQCNLCRKSNESYQKQKENKTGTNNCHQHSQLFTQEKRKYIAVQVLYINVQRSSICNSENLEIIQILISRGMDKQIAVYSFGGILLSNGQEEAIATHTT